MKKVLVTGSSGFLGRHFVKKLEEAGHFVIPYDILTGQDLMNAEQLENAIKESDYVFHLAAQANLNFMKERPYDGTILNVGCTHNVAHFCAKHSKWLVYISTVCVYGNQKVHPVTEEMLPNPSELYACTKLAGELIVQGYGKNYDMPYTILRIPTMHGEGMRPELGVRVFIEQALDGKPITVHGDGKQVRTLTYVGDVADAMVKVIDNDKVRNEIITISSDDIISANQMAEDIRKLVGKEVEIVHIEQRPNQTFWEEFDLTKAKTLLGWEAKTKWIDGLKKTLDWIITTRNTSRK